MRSSISFRAASDPAVAANTSACRLSSRVRRSAISTG